MNECRTDLVENEKTEVAKNERLTMMSPAGCQGVHYTSLPPAKAGEPLADEWNTYRQEVGRLLTEGLEGQYVLIKGKEILGVFHTWKQAREEGLNRYQLEPFFVHEIRVSEPHLRVRGLNF